MNWSGCAVILSIKKHRERDRIVTFFSSEFGKRSGIFLSSKQTVQIGDVCHVNLSGRLSDGLCLMKIEPIYSPFLFICSDVSRLFAMQSACQMCCSGLAYNDSDGELFLSFKKFLIEISKPDWAMQYVFFELAFLSAIGYGLDCRKCAVTGSTSNLFYISPKTGKAVIKSVGDQYKDKLFVIPNFWFRNIAAIGDNGKAYVSEKDDVYSDVLYSLMITSHFLKIYFQSIGKNLLPSHREYFIKSLRLESRI